ncbi:hypothetical protein CMV_027040, partial [Castanea mollissima]
RQSIVRERERERLKRSVLVFICILKSETNTFFYCN